MKVGDKISWKTNGEDRYGRVIAVAAHHAVAFKLGDEGIICNVPLDLVESRTRYVSGDHEWESEMLPSLLRSGGETR